MATIDDFHCRGDFTNRRPVTGRINGQCQQIATTRLCHFCQRCQRRVTGRLITF